MAHNQWQPYMGGPPQHGYGPPQGGYPPSGYHQPPPPNQYPPHGYPGYPPPGPPSPQPQYYQPPPPTTQPHQYPTYQTPPPLPPNPGYSQYPLPPAGHQHAPSPPDYGRPAYAPPATSPYGHPGHGLPPPPPQAPQNFPGAPANYNYQYSNCTGRRKALLIGINYFNQRGELRGCINDVRNMSAYLNENFGYAREDMVILTDDQQNPMSQPTKANILRAMHWLVKDARPNDSLFFHFSGHGGQTEDLDGDEDDGYDEVIYPVDFRTAGHIVDDELHRILVNPLAPGVRLTAIFDSCHSGSALDLPYVYSTSGVLKEPNLGKEAAQGLLGLVTAYSRGDVSSMAKNVMSFYKKATKGDAAQERALKTKTSPADVVMWSGSKDEQKSQDAHIGGQATGAMSWAFITSLKKNPRQSYVQLLNSIRDELAAKYTQRPQLSCSHPLNTDLLYVM